MAMHAVGIKASFRQVGTKEGAMGLTWRHSVCSGCPNKMPQTRGLNNRLISHSLGVWKSKIKVLVGRTFFLACR